MIKEVHIKLVPLSTIRNNDVGDYFWEGDSLFINVVDLPEYSHSMLIAIHELIEAFMTDYQGIKEEDINKFDALYDAERVGGLHADEEPGFDNRACYRDAHTLCTAIEMMICAFLKISWKDYNG